MENLKRKIDTSNRILLVEDEPTNMAILSSFLEENQYLVDTASNGKEALDILQKDNNFSCVISDRRMPVMDGLQLAQAMKKNATLCGIPVIIQTGATSAAEVAEGFKAGVFYFLTKPFETDVLLSVTQSAIRDREKNMNFELRQQRQYNALSTIVQGEFHLRTFEDAQNIASFLGSLFPRADLAMSGLYELIINAIEHGNLKIGFEEKGRLLSESRWDAEIRNRLALPENKNKKVIVQYSNNGRHINVLISDQGNGFDPRPFMEIEPSRATKANGRGIAKANLLCFDRIAYLGKGNQVQVSTDII